MIWDVVVAMMVCRVRNCCLTERGCEYRTINFGIPQHGTSVLSNPPSQSASDPSGLFLCCGHGGLIVVFSLFVCVCKKFRAKYALSLYAEP